MKDKKLIPRWDELVRVDVYLGYSKKHSSNEDAVLNLKNGHASPQFYAVFDDDFDTVDALRHSMKPSRW